MSDAGICKIKPEFILEEHKRELDLNCVSERDKRKFDSESTKEETSDNDAKKFKLSKKKLKGQNKSRKHTYQSNQGTGICNNFLKHLDINENLDNFQCPKQSCNYLHSLEEYLKLKPDDLGDSCYNFDTFGYCSRGITCRFSKAHIDSSGKNIKTDEKIKLYENKQQTFNQLKLDVQQALRKKQYDFNNSIKIIQHSDSLKKDQNKTAEENNHQSGCVTDEDVIALLSREKKKIDFRDKLYLSPLTTVGNLPFRRICKEFGVDITCGEMAMAKSILQGLTQEWALVKRHHTEDLFGVQICGNNPHLLTRCAQLLDQETLIDFVDLNLGCPIELVFREGGGCGLLRRRNVLESCVRNVSQVLSKPLTVKTRTGISSGTNLAHTLIPKFAEWGASLVTVHGRSREQRYTRNADWDYVEQCAQLAPAEMPVFGNGDVLSYVDYEQVRSKYPSVAGVMIGRGALIKPWIFTEIKERKVWDISSAERLDILKKYVNYGLEHWGSDTKGVENTRRFLLEWLSFLYRYVPVGILECIPQKINERPPYYKGRDDLETLMASPAASDWVKISEMLLGPVPEGFQFLPKHKANSYK